MPINPFTEQGAFAPEAAAAMGEALTLPAESFATSGGFK
jgi:hypothetical protein